jgi:hypothetical protein
MSGLFDDVLEVFMAGVSRKALWPRNPRDPNLSLFFSEEWQYWIDMLVVFLLPFIIVV